MGFSLSRALFVGETGLDTTPFGPVLAQAGFDASLSGGSIVDEDRFRTATGFAFDTAKAMAASASRPLWNNNDAGEGDGVGELSASNACSSDSDGGS